MSGTVKVDDLMALKMATDAVGGDEQKRKLAAALYAIATGGAVLPDTIGVFSVMASSRNQPQKSDNHEQSPSSL